MKVLTVVGSLGPGGTERAAQNYSLGLKAAGVDVAVLSGDAGPRAETLQAAGIPVFVWGSDKATMRFALKKADEYSPSIIHIHRHCETETSTAVLKRLVRTDRRVVETNVFSKFDSSPGRYAIDVSLQLSRWCLWKWRSWAGSVGERPAAAVLSYAVDSRRFTRLTAEERVEARRDVGIPDSAFVFGRVGQPIRAKWSPTVISAFSRVAAESSEARMLLVGMPDSLNTTLESLPEGIRSRVQVLPPIWGDERLRRVYGAMDVFLHAAEIGESFGYVLCEAMLCGVPVITLSRPARDNTQIELVGHMVGGLVTAHKNDLASAMRLLMRDSEMRSRLQSGAPASIRARYDIALVTNRLVKVFEVALSCSSRRQIEERLATEGFTVNVKWCEIRELLSRSIGAPSTMELLIARAKHTPTGRLLETRLKAWKGRAPGQLGAFLKRL
jgi:glycosyltransferase involved in cell wall biosynthesis